MHFSWATGRNEQRFSYRATSITDLLLFLFPFSRGNVLATTSSDSLRMRRTQASKCSHFNGSRVVRRRGWGSGYPQLQLHESPVILHLLHCHSRVKLDPFLQEKRIHDFISNLSLPFGASNWKLSHDEASSSRSWMLTRQNSLQVLTRHILLLLWLHVHLWWVITFDNQQRKTTPVTVSFRQCKYFPTDAENDTEGLSSAG